jgi:hypothetical protein
MSTITHGAAAAGALIMSFYSDLRGSRIEPIVLSGVFCIFANLVLAVWNIPDGLKFFAYISVGWSYGTIPVLISWTAEGLANDLEVRAIALASYNTISEICGLVVPLIAWPVSKAPGFRGGFIWVSCLLLYIWLMLNLLRRLYLVYSIYSMLPSSRLSYAGMRRRQLWRNRLPGKSRIQRQWLYSRGLQSYNSYDWFIAPGYL